MALVVAAIPASYLITVIACMLLLGVTLLWWCMNLISVFSGP